MRFHWQNLNDRKHRPNGWGIFHGRCWLHLGRWLSAHAEWFAFPQPIITAEVTCAGLGDDHVLFHLKILGLGIFIGISTRWTGWLWRRASKRDGFECGFRFGWWDRTLKLNIDIAGRVMSSHSKDPWWIRGIRWDFADIIFGRHKHNKRIISTTQIVIPMPEGCYPATCELNECTWTRPRLPWFPLRGHGASVDIPGGIGFAGKGENSWDCGDDGLYGQSSGAKSIEEAIGKVVESVLKSRRRNGDASWLQGTKPVMYVKPKDPVR